MWPFYLFIYLPQWKTSWCEIVEGLRLWLFPKSSKIIQFKKILNCLPTHCIGFSLVKIMTHWSVVFFSRIYHLHEGWMKVGSQTFPKLKEGERERESEIDLPLVHNAWCPTNVFFNSDFFLDFNKEKGVVKGLLLLFCSRLKTSLILHMVAKSSPWLETSLPSITPLLSTISPKAQSCQMSCCYELTKESLFLQMTCYEDHLSCDLVGHWICHTHQWCNGQGH